MLPPRRSPLLCRLLLLRGRRVLVEVGIGHPLVFIVEFNIVVHGVAIDRQTTCVDAGLGTNELF
jgi:hypothetical protein